MYKIVAVVMALLGTGAGPFVITALVSGALGAAQAQNRAADAKRVKALLIGIAAYPRLGKAFALPRTIADAEGFRQVLTQNYKVPPGNIVLLKNPTSKAMAKAWKKHVGGLGSRDISIFFFSGHGAEHGAEPLLLPSDYDRTAGPSHQGRPLKEFVDRLKRRRPDNLGIFIVDACRNPIGEIGGKYLEDSGGFAPVRAADGTFIFFAAGARQIALHDLGMDDRSSYSVYTRGLLPLLADPQRSLHNIAKSVRWTTYQLALKRRDANGRPIPHLQVPAYFDEVLERRNIIGTPLKKPAAPDPIRGPATGELAGAKGFQWVCPTCPELVEVPLPDDPITVRGRQVVLSQRFAMGKYEVTRDQWRACQDAGACKTIDPEIVAGDRRPITGVSWHDTQDFLRWLNEIPGLGGFRLPSEAEWQYAASGGSHAAHGPASGVEQLCTYANGADASLKTLLWANPFCNDGKGRGVASAGSYRSNYFGLHDMQGNAWEWVSDCRDAQPAGGGQKCLRHVAKGGSWRSGPETLKIGAFQAFPANARRRTVGFRIVRDVE